MTDEAWATRHLLESVGFLNVTTSQADPEVDAQTTVYCPLAAESRVQLLEQDMPPDGARTSSEEVSETLTGSDPAGRAGACAGIDA